MLTSRLFAFLLVFATNFINASHNFGQNKFGENLQRVRHAHRRRSLLLDPRYLNFKFEVEPENVIIGANGAALFHCAYRIGTSSSASALKSSEELPVADARVEWRKDGTPVDQIRSPGRIRTLGNGSLSIENAGPADEGIYQCAVHVNSSPFVANTPWIFLSRRVTLHAAHFDRFESQPTDHSVFSGQKAAFRCLINSKPPATIEWYRENSPLKIEGSIVVLPVSQTLEISNVSVRHEGDYKCVARNGARTRSSQIATLSVKDDANDVAGTLSVVLEPRNQVLRVGDAFILECLVNGFPAPKFVWHHNDRTIVLDGRRRLVGTANSSLLVESAEISDAGNYVCRAENDEDSVDLAASIAIRTPPKITLAPKDEATQETLDAEFECVADGVPKPRIIWYKNGEIIIPSEYFVIASNRLKIFGLVKDDQGVYQCFAENDIGSTQASAQLLVDASASHLALTSGGVGDVEKRQTPSAPLSLRVGDLAPRQFTVSWDPPPHASATISSYHVFFREEDSTRERLINSTSNFVTLSSLQPNTVYVVRVVGENDAGLGKSSETIRVTTKREDRMPGKVRNLRAEVLGSETIRVDWDAPSPTSGADAARYRLFYIKENALDDEHETQVLMVKTSYTLHGMDKFTKYFIRVEAEGANGVGPSSERLEVRTFADVPSAAPKNVRAEALSPTSIRVRWSAPDAEHRNGPLSGYKIRYKTKRKGSKGNAVVVDGDPGVHVLDGLESGTHYLIRIAAMSVNGTGAFSDWLGVETPAQEREETQIAGAPSELRVHAGHDFVEVAWLPPRDDNIMIRGYLVGWGVNIPDVEKASVDASVRHYTIKGLKPSREYVISLRAFNNVGNGFPIYETVQTTAYDHGHSTFHRHSFSAANEAGVLSANDGGGARGDEGAARMLTPVGVIAEPVSASSIRLSWTDPNDGFNQYYTVRYSSSADNNGHTRLFNTSETEVVVDGLKPNTQYEFAVRLVESADWSMSAVNKTLPAPPSSAPRDLSIFAAYPTAGEENLDSVTLSWQPPKYANGEIEEYIVLYSDKLELPDKDWIMDNVKGDRLSMIIRNLMPASTYYFKIQARNAKGYGPLSPVVTYAGQRRRGIEFGGDGGARKRAGDDASLRANASSDSFYAQLGQMLTNNFIYVLIGIVGVVLLFLVIVLAVVCGQRKTPSSTNAKRTDYVEGRKFSASTLSRNNSSQQQQQQPDLWIHQQLQQQNSGPNRFALLSNGQPVEFIEVSAPPHIGAHDATNRFCGNMAQHLGSADSPPPRYQTLQESGGTLSRSYHQSSSSLEMPRQKTPQIVYTGVNRQPIAKVEFAPSASEQGSHAGSMTMLQYNGANVYTTPPASSSLNGDTGNDAHVTYQALRTLNPLKSFAQMGGAPPPPLSSPYLSGGGEPPNGGEQRRTAHIVRPVVVASPTLRNAPAGNGAMKPAGIVTGQKSTLNGKLPIGRATAQPRVDVSEGIHSPYSTVRVTSDALNNNSAKKLGSSDFGMMKTDFRMDAYINRYNENENDETKPLKSMLSAENMNDVDLDQGLDHMIDTLQQLQQEFTER